MGKTINKRKIILNILIIFTVLLCLSAVSAEDLSISDSSSSDLSNPDLSISESTVNNDENYQSQIAGESDSNNQNNHEDLQDSENSELILNSQDSEVSSPILGQSDSVDDVVADGGDDIVVIIDKPDPSVIDVVVILGERRNVYGNTFQDIQNVIDNSNDGDDIYLGSGTYYGSGTPLKANKADVAGNPKNIGIIGAGPNDKATLDAQFLSNILIVGNENQVSVENIIFKNGKVSSGGSTSDLGGAIMWGGPNGRLTNCDFMNNHADYAGGAVVWCHNDGIVQNCNFVNNSAQYGSAYLSVGYRDKIVNSRFDNNPGSYSAVYFCSDGARVEYCTFANHNMITDGTIRINGEGASVVGSSFVNNSISTSGAAILWNGVNGYISGCSFENNHASKFAGCIGFSSSSANTSISGCSFNNNSASQYGGCIFLDKHSTNISVSDCTFINNSADEYGGCIFSNNATYINVSNSIFIDNTAGDGPIIVFNYGSDDNSASGSYIKHKANTTTLSVAYDDLAIRFTLGGYIDYDDSTIGISTYLLKNSYWFGSYNKTAYNPDGDILGANQNITIEIYNSRNSLVDTITGLTDSNGQISYDYRNLPDGQYTFKVRHLDNDDFAFVQEEGSFTRYHTPTNLSISVTNVTYPGTAVATITASSPGTYKLVIAGTNYNDLTFTESEISNGGGKASKTVNVNLLGAKDNYVASVSYELNDHYSAASNQTMFNVYKAGSGIDVNDVSVYYSQDTEIAYMVENASGANIVSIRNSSNTLVEGRDYNIASNNNGKIIIRGLAEGTYTVNMTNVVDSNHSASTKVFTLIINPLVDLGISLSVNNQTPLYGDTIVYTITLINNGPSIATDVVVTDIIPEGMNVSSSDASYIGNGVWNIDSIGVGSENAATLTLYATLNNIASYVSNVSVLSNEHDSNANNNEAVISVNAISISNLSIVSIANAASVKVDDLITYTITVANLGSSDASGVKVTGVLSSLLKFVSAVPSLGSYDSSANLWDIGDLAVDDSANLTLTFKALSSGTVKNTFSVKSDDYDPDTSDNSVDCADVPVNKISTKITAKAMTTTAIDIKVDGKKGQYFTLTLKDANNNPLANKNVQITLNKVVYKVKTDSKGIAKIQVNIKKAGTYTASIKFAGDGKYLGSSASVKVKVNKQKPKLASSKKTFKVKAKTKKVTATLKTSRGKVLKSKKITFTIKGKKYSAKTNSKGIATLNVRLTKKGSYTASIKFAGDSTYSAVTKKIKVVIK